MKAENQEQEAGNAEQDVVKHNPTNKLALADLDDRARYFASGNLDIWAIRHINEEYSK